MNKDRATTAILGVASALSGLACVIVPYVLRPDTSGNKIVGCLFPLGATAWEYMEPGTTMSLLAMLGLLLGLAEPPKWLLHGIATMSILPMVSFAELFACPGSHNLFGIELILYAVVAVPAVIGAFAGSRLRALTKRERPSKAL